MLLKWGLQDLVYGADRLPSLPEIFYRLMEVMDDPDSAFEDIGEVISCDPALTARLLKIANSPLFGYSGKIETVSHALSVTGMSELRDLAFTTLIMENFKGMSNRVLSLSSFWEHSLCVATMARELADALGVEDNDRHFMLGLLHNIGHLLLCVKAPQAVEKIVEHSLQNEIFYTFAERTILGYDHCTAGALLLKSWKLPPEFQSVTKNHHSPSSGRDFPLETAIVHAADHFSRSFCIGGTSELFLPNLENQVQEIMNMDENRIKKLFIEKAVPRFREISSMFLQAA